MAINFWVSFCGKLLFTITCMLIDELWLRILANASYHIVRALENMIAFFNDNDIMVYG